MAKFLWIAFLTTTLSAAFAFAGNDNNEQAPGQYSLICESHGGYVECEAGVQVANVSVEKQKSREACTFGGSWGYHGSRIWVNHGCRASFSYDDANMPVPPPTPNPTPAPTPQPPAPITQVDCRWNNMNWQPYYHGNYRFIGNPGYGFQDPNMCAYTVRLSKHNAVCNWNGIGFTSYDIVTNAEVIAASYANVESCYAALR